MIKRANYAQLSSESYNALLALARTMDDSPLGHTILDLVRIRASQLNGCLFCLDLHVKEARTHGERELRLHHIALWHESKLFSEKEKAALEWAEILTQINPQGVEDEDYEKARDIFSEKELSDLTFAVGLINMWNRFGVAFRNTPGSMDKIMGVDKIGLS